MNKGFEPIYDKDSRVLILGSFPSVVSRAHNFYYSNPQNSFWQTLERIFGEEVGKSPEEKTAFLLSHNIALYDVIAEADIEGSEDEVLMKSEHKKTDLSQLLPPHTHVQKILCNGYAAHDLAIAQLEKLGCQIETVYVPSTSPSNRSHFDFEQWKTELLSGLSKN